MTISVSRYIAARATIIIALMAVCMTAATAKPDTARYTRENPLRIVSDWNFAPYEYTNDSGEPEGYNISILTSILDRLDIPYVFILRKLDHAVSMFNQGKADLMIEPVYSRSKPDGKRFYSRKTLAPYKVKVAYRRGTKPLKDLSKLEPEDTLILKKYDYATKMILARDDISRRQIVFRSPRASLQELASSDRQYFVWGEKPIEKMLKELNITDIEVGEIDIPAGEMRFVSHDKRLIEILDEQFARMEQQGTVNKLKNKWFHPDIDDNDASPVVLIIIIAAAILVIVTVIANRIITARIRKSTQLTVEKNNIMQAALKISRQNVICTNLKTGRISNVYGNHVPETGIKLSQYSERIHPEDRQKLKDAAQNISGSTENSPVEYIYRWNAGTEDAPVWRMIHCNSIREAKRNGKVANIISTLTDITDDLANEQQAGETAMTYSSIFEMTITGLSLHDSRGFLIDANRRMRELLRFNTPKDEFYYNKCWLDFPSIKDAVGSSDMTEVHFCTKIDVPERNVSEYVEIRLRPIRNEEDELVYILIALRPISEERDLYQLRKKNNDTLRDIRQAATRAEEELMYLLEESKTRVWRASFADRTVSFYKGLHNQGVTISMDRIIECTINENDKPLTRNFIDPPHDSVTTKTAVLVLRNMFENDGKKRWYSMNRMPNHDSNGNVIGTFGLIRDVTELIETQEELKQETLRANESERQKSMFLANMSHEIRTPLNSIVGFCDLLQSVDAPEDRKEFLRIIRNNCSMLLHIINDVLIISSMDNDGPTIEPHDVDFAATFDDVCATFVQQVSENGIELIKENPYRSLRTKLDNDRIQQVIVNFMTNAIKHTRQGHIRVGYRIEDGGIRIYCEDTGSGIPKEKCEDVFRRFVKLNDFVQGTGLGLSICKAIADSCGGRIGVDSELGKGSTFWIWIPCDIENVEEKD